MSRIVPQTDRTTFAYLAWSLGALGFLYAWFHRVTPSVMVDHLMADFAVSGAVLGTLSSLYFYAYASLQLPVGAIVDRWGPRVPFACALLVAASGSALFASAERIEWAYLGRILIGGGAAFAWVSVLKITALHFPPSRFAMLSGAGMFIGLIGGFSGQVAAGAIVDALGWRATMWGLAVAGLGLAMAVWTLLNRHDQAVRRDAPPETIAAVLSGLRNVLRQPRIWMVAGGGAIGAAPIFVFASLWGVPFLMQTHGMTRPAAASLTATMLIGWGLGAFLFGWISDRLGQRRRPLLAGLLVALLTLTAAIYLPGLPNLALGGLLAMAGLGSGAIILTYAMSGDLASHAARGSAYGFANMLVILSGAVFQPLTGWLLDLNWSGKTVEGARLYDAETYATAFLVVPVTFAVAIAMIASSGQETSSALKDT